MKIDELRQNQARLEQTKKLKEKTLEDNRRKISELSQDLVTIGGSGDVLEGVEQDLAAAVREGGQGRCVREGGQGRCVREGGQGRCVKEGGQGRCVREGGQGRCVREGGQGRCVREGGQGRCVKEGGQGR